MIRIAHLEGETYRIEVQELGDSLYRCAIGEAEWVIDSRRISPHTYSLLIDGQSFTVHVVSTDAQYSVGCGGRSFRIHLRGERGYGTDRERMGIEGEKDVRALMPGKVVELLVAVGAKVTKDQGLLIVEAMKMENEVRAPSSGVVKKILVAPGETVESGELLVVLE